ncbi:MAG: undecaprenyl diphosphate synthase family protein [Thermoplasmata archaeon]|nr:MAG: undecaprenyl diphosphate synthase family protein [Thermoplasmata archaeon]
MPRTYSREEFMSLPTNDFVNLINDAKKPRVGVLIPDGTRKIGVIYYGLDSNSPEFEAKLFQRINKDLMEVVKLFFNHGLHTFFVPCLTNGNLARNEHYVEKAVRNGLEYILKSDEWLDFYDERKIRVKIYGDYERLTEMGFAEVADWISDVQARTAKFDRHILYFGIACSNREEMDRILDYAIDFHQEHGRRPSREELISWYYNGAVDDVDFFIRPTMFRDSDVQPPLISGVKTQMYFPIGPFPFLNTNMVREIFFDLLYNRTITHGNDTESLDNLTEAEAELINNYYTENRDKIIGLGNRIGDFWLPSGKIKSLKSDKRKIDE